MATIKDVAALAGVSFTTVSHVLNNTRPVSGEARARVEQAILKLNYVLSAVARSLKGQSTTSIGLVVPNSTNPYFAEVARGIEEYCAQRGYCVFFCNSEDDPAKQRAYLRVLQEKRVDGLIVASAGDDAVLAATLADSPAPLVLVDRQVEGLAADLVQIDHERGAYLATRYLLELGHARIACISGPVERPISGMRVHGYMRALAERGIKPGAIVQAEYSCVGGYDAARELFDGERPSAIFAANDLLAIGALRAAAERGLRVPEACSIIGFDDIEWSRYTYPSLSTVGHSIGELGQTAARMLIERIAGLATSAPRRHVLTPQLIARESTGTYEASAQR